MKPESIHAERDVDRDDHKIGFKLVSSFHHHKLVNRCPIGFGMQGTC